MYKEFNSNKNKPDVSGKMMIPYKVFQFLVIFEDIFAKIKQQFCLQKLTKFIYLL